MIPTMIGICAECNRLWQQRAAAVSAHLRIVGQYQAAVIEQNSAALLELERICSVMKERRASIRKALEDHEHAMHNRKAATAGGDRRLNKSFRLSASATREDSQAVRKHMGWLNDVGWKVNPTFPAPSFF